MSIIKRTQLSAFLGVSRAAITKAVKAGTLIIENGMINTENPVNKYYIASRGIILSEQEVKNMPKKTSRAEKPIIKSSNVNLTSEEVANFIARKKKADAEHAELKNQKIRGDLLDAQMVHDYVFIFLDNVSNSMQRNAGAFLSDVASRIVNEGGLNSSIRTQWQNVVSDQFEKAKKEIIKRLEKVKENQIG